MSKIDHQALREAAEKATWGDWDSYKPHRGAKQTRERVRSKMKNRKAKILLVRRNAPGVWQWVRLSNRRMGLMKYYGMMDCGFCKKPSAAQNRWKNHLRTKGE
ncbi:prophage protein [Escherichia coli]|nr:prophage protein [Escherichia coli]